MHNSSKAIRVLNATSMVFGRGKAARLIAEMVDVRSGDTLVDIGCGPGTAAREAARRGAVVIGVDPDPLSLRFARWISLLSWMRSITWLLGTAEDLPVPDGSASLAWSLSSLHHWSDREQGLREAHRVARPGGRLVLSERVVKPMARGHAAHGVTEEGLEELKNALTATGFLNVRSSIRQAGHRTLAIVMADRD